MGRGEASRRFLAFLLVAVLLFGLVFLPTAPKAEAFIVEQAIISAFVMVATAMGLSFVADSSEALADYISNYLAGFTSSGGLTVVDFALTWLVGGTLKLQQDQAQFFTEAVSNLVQVDPQVVYAGSYMSLDGFRIDLAYTSAVNGSRLYFWDASNPVVYATYHPFAWYPAFGYTLSYYNSTYTRVDFFDGSSQLPMQLYSSSASSASVALWCFDTGTGVVRCAMRSSADTTTYLDSYGIGAYLKSVRASAIAGTLVSTQGEIDAALADLANQMDATKVMEISTPYSPAEVLSQAQAGTLVVTQPTIGENTDEDDDSIGAVITDSLTSVFVPSAEVVQAKVAALSGVFADRMGILTYPASVLADFTGRMLVLSDQEPIFRWDDVIIQGVVVIPAGQYNLRSAVASAPFSYIYSVYRAIVSALLVFMFLDLCHKKYEQVIKGGAG